MTRNLINNPFGSVVNNAILDPLAGFDVEVWCTDLATGQILDVGQFQSCTFTIRNATETYLPLGTRSPRYYDGEIQIAWVLERGKLSTDYLEAWFGTSDISADKYLSRGPRFQITVDFNAVELQGTVSDTTYVVNSVKKPSPNFFNSDTKNFLMKNRQAKGQLHLTRCKLDSMSTGIMPGRRIIADRWEGVAEGIWHQNDFSSQNKDTLRSQVLRGQSITNAAPGLLIQQGNDFPSANPNSAIG